MQDCKQPYTPPAIQQNPTYLVVDGFLNVGQDSTIITLSRTRNLDSIIPVPELNAQLMVIGASGEQYPLYEQGNGKYATDHLNLNFNENYQLRIITSDNKEYLSDTIMAKSTPPIDSLQWGRDSTGVHIYVTTHDPQNSTRYYRWDYVETWQYRTAFESYFDWVDGAEVLRPYDQHIYNCWMADHSTDIFVANSAKLSQDVIYQFPVCFIPQGSEKLSIKYSILVNQYAISEQAYDYWQILKKNTEQTGSLFDPQPSQTTGNIHSMSNPGEPVLGFIGACSLQQKRIFINGPDVANWNYYPYYAECTISDTIKPVNLDQEFAPNVYHFLVYMGSNNGAYFTTPVRCGDCRDHGGTNQKPSFWQ